MSVMKKLLTGIEAVCWVVSVASLVAALNWFNTARSFLEIEDTDPTLVRGVLEDTHRSLSFLYICVALVLAALGARWLRMVISKHLILIKSEIG